MILNKNVVPILIALAMVVTITFVGVTPINAQPSEVWVDGDYCDGCPNDGHTWGYNAFDKIHDGIDAVASPGTVHVAAGTYYENITLKDGVQLLGAGTDVTTIDGGGASSVVTASSVGSDTLINGFTITNGYGDPGEHGGGIRCENSSPTIVNCNIIDNTLMLTCNGGGIYCFHAFPTITDCTISGNTAEYGGGIYCKNSSPTIRNCTISGNTAEWIGGGIYCLESSPEITNCTINGNVTKYDGGGIYCGPASTPPTITNCIINGNTGSGIDCVSSPTITNCTISDNTSGGITCCWASPTITDCTISGNMALDGGGIYCFDSSPTIINCVISGNMAYFNGGGIYCTYSSFLTITNCTITGNTGGGMSCTDSSLTITNSIFWADSPYEIDVYMSNALVTYSDIEGGWEGEGNISADPMFVNSENGDYHLQENSPCIDVGTNDAPELPDTDFEGDPRIVDGDNDATRTVDMGADEYLQFIEIELDIKPGSYPNSINLKSKGKVPVAVLTTDDFDAYDVDPDTCVFANANPLRWKMEDVDNDSDDDMLFHFKTRELDLTKESTGATLEGETFGGIQIIGTDSVKIVPEDKGYGKKSK